MLGLGADREVLVRGVRRRLCLAGAHAARPRYSGRLRPAQERDREAFRPRAHGVAGDGDGGVTAPPRSGKRNCMSLIGRIIVIFFAFVMALMVAGILLAIGIVGPDWAGADADPFERVTFFFVSFVATSFAGAAATLP